jgi:hypothetical protein
MVRASPPCAPCARQAVGALAVLEVIQAFLRCPIHRLPRARHLSGRRRHGK